MNVTLIWLAALLALGCHAPPEAGTWHEGTVVDVSVGTHPIDVVAVDVDRDGKLDLVSANPGDFSISVRLRRDAGWEPAPGDPVRMNVHPHLIAVGDIDRDGDADLLATSHDSGNVWTWLGDGTGRFAAAGGSPFTALAVTRPHNHGLAVGDVDGDGAADAVVADQEQRIAVVLHADGRGGLAPMPGPPIALGGQPYPPVLGDVDGDGRLDLVAPLLDTHAVAVMLGDGRGGFAHAPGSPHRTAKQRPYAVLLVDLDGDGRLDVVAAHDDTDHVSVLLGAGGGRLRAGPGSPVALGKRIWRMAAADVDDDGTIDLVGAGSGALMVVPGDGRGGLGRPLLEPSGGWTPVAADLDGDGRLDVASPQPDQNVLRLWLGARRAD